MARKPDIKRFHQWLDSYTREDLVALITKDFNKHKLSENTAIMFGYRRKIKPNHPAAAPAPKPKSFAFTGDVPHLDRPYTMEEAEQMYEQDGQISGTVRIEADEFCDSLGDELQSLLAGLLVDSNAQQLRKDLDIEIAGCDSTGLFFNVTCHTDPCANGQPIDK